MDNDEDRKTGSVAPPAWGEMETDCLVDVFHRLPLDDLAAAAPLVCRGWRRAASDPSLWRALDLGSSDAARFLPRGALARRLGVARFSFAGFLAICLARAAGTATVLALPPLLSSADLDRVAAGCPLLRRLALPPLLSAADDARLPDLVPRWPHLRRLELGAKAASFPALVARLAAHCPDLAGLRTSGAIKPEDAAAVAASLPGLRSLCLDSSYLPKRELLAILDGCVRLEELSARNCVGFDGEDEEVLARGARIQRFQIGGSRTRVVRERGHDYGATEGSSSYVHAMSTALLLVYYLVGPRRVHLFGLCLFIWLIFF